MSAESLSRRGKERSGSVGILQGAVSARVISAGKSKGASENRDA